MTDGLEESRNYWDRHARRDPLWAILSDAAKRDGRWDTTRFLDIGAFLNQVAEAPADLILAGEVLAGRRFVDDDDARRFLIVVVGE